MTHDRIHRVRGLVMFVVAWLIGLYVYQVVQEALQGRNESIGFLAAVLTMGASLYARKKAATAIQATFMFRFWLYLPVILFVAVPITIKVIVYLAGEGDGSWWNHLLSLLPFFLKLGVPVAALLWVYRALGKLTIQPVEAPKPSGVATAEPP